ncbi:DUF302 domain-containing protein [Pseudonocardia hydrocarbonoxydans]|uniref:DUF302 domain-containing protein n=1 Tax=Pseudonocardia hydrocarbonoxydans TaxID=76726 RepID=UPI0031D28AB5
MAHAWVHARTDRRRSWDDHDPRRGPPDPGGRRADRDDPAQTRRRRWLTPKEGNPDMEYGKPIRLHTGFAEAVERVRAALADQGFGVLTEIDVRTTLRDKLGTQMEDYLILGACNPPLAHRALDIDRSIGTLLPCNVVVRTDAGEALVEAADPHMLVELTGRGELQAVADEAAGKLAAALESLTESPTSTKK